MDLLKHLNRNSVGPAPLTCSVPAFLHGVKSRVVWSDPTLTTNSPSGSQLRSWTALKWPDMTTAGLHSLC